MFGASVITILTTHYVKKLKKQNISDTDNWDSYQKAFKDDNLIIEKDNTMGIEGDKCRLLHRIRRAFRKTCY